MNFILCFFGERFIGMFLACLESIVQSNPKAGCRVYWQDCPQDIIDAVSAAYPTFSFHKTHFDFSSDMVDRIASKTLMWRHALTDTPQDVPACFIDVDTLVVDDVTNLFENPEDIFLTKIDEPTYPYPLNTGVVGIRNSRKVQTFFDAWVAETIRILKSPEEKKQASSREFPYGAPDQMALYKMIQFSREKELYLYPDKGGEIALRIVPGSSYNFIFSAPVTPQVRIIHYKGMWHKMLIDGDDFSVKRTKEASWEMYMLFLEHFFNGLERVKKYTQRTQPSDWNISVPFYLNAQHKEIPFLYTLFSLRSKILSPLRTFKERATRGLRRLRG